MIKRYRKHTDPLSVRFYWWQRTTDRHMRTMFGWRCVTQDPRDLIKSGWRYFTLHNKSRWPFSVYPLQERIGNNARLHAILDAASERRDQARS